MRGVAVAAIAVPVEVAGGVEVASTVAVASAGVLVGAGVSVAAAGVSDGAGAGVLVGPGVGVSTPTTSEATLPPPLRATHRSLFDGSLQGIERTDVPAFSFQGHPEASPGPRDLAPLFSRFVEVMLRREALPLRKRV